MLLPINTTREPEKGKEREGKGGKGRGKLIILVLCIDNLKQLCYTKIITTLQFIEITLPLSSNQSVS